MALSLDPNLTQSKNKLPDLSDTQALAEFFSQLPTVNEHCVSAEAELMQKMGIDFHTLGAEQMICSMPVAGNRQTIGILHGGANAVLGETTGSVAANYAAREGEVAVGVDIIVTHHRPADSGRVYCVATQLKAGRKLVHYELKIFNEQGKLTASGSHTCAFIPRSK